MDSSPAAGNEGRRPRARVDHRIVLASSLLGLLAAALVAGSGRAPGERPGFPLDDAWIHLVYGRSLAREGLLAFDAGVPATGCTSPLWAASLALVHLVAGPSVDAVVVGVEVLGALLHALGAGLAAGLALAAGGRPRTAFLAGALVALSPWLAAASLSGMEVALCAALLVGGLRALALERPGRAGLWLGAAVSARPESAAVVAAVACAVLLGRGEAPWRRLVRAARVAAPAVLVAGAWAAYGLAVRGRVLPTTYELKEQSSWSALPGRFGVALTELLAQVAPFAGAAGLVAWTGVLAALVLRKDGRRARVASVAGLAYLAANLWVIDPEDPAAFYHLRYLLPAVPLLVVGAALGAGRIGERLPRRFAALPELALAAAGAFGVARTLVPIARHYHGDVRSIDAVQRAMGEWIAAHVPPGAWVAASDVGAVRYISDRPVVDVMGLNTPALYDDSEAFVRRHPVAAAALMDVWFLPVEQDVLERAVQLRAEDYGVTSDPRMAIQSVWTCPPLGAATRRRVAFRGLGAFELDFVPGAAR